MADDESQTPERRFWDEPNWYDKGGWLPPGLTLAVNESGEPEPVRPPQED